MRRRFSIEEEPEDVHRWLLSYADFITLMFTFFVALYALSSMDTNKVQDFSLSLRQVFKVVDLPIAIHPSSAKRAIIEDIRAVLKDHAGLSVKMDPRGVVITFSDAMLFPSGSADIKPESVSILDSIAQIVAKQPGHIIVEGHTDNVPMSGGIFKSNWELAGARASSVLHFLVAKGGDPQRFTFAGFASYKPIAVNDTEEGRARNRRVEIVIEGAGGEIIAKPVQ